MLLQFFSVVCSLKFLHIFLHIVFTHFQMCFDILPLLIYSLHYILHNKYIYIYIYIYIHIYIIWCIWYIIIYIYVCVCINIYIIYGLIIYMHINLFFISFLFYIYINIPFSTYYFQALNTRPPPKKRKTCKLSFVFLFIYFKTHDWPNFIDSFLICETNK